jgi:hypothetical protein
MFAITIEHVLSGTSLRGYNLQTIEVTLIEWSAVDAVTFCTVPNFNVSLFCNCIN